jgi:predicted transcriptional regulator
MRRSRVEIILDVLSVLAEGGIKKTWIMNRCALSYKVLLEILADLEEKGLVIRDFTARSRDTVFVGRDIDRTRYSLTPKGFESLNIYRQLSLQSGIAYESARLVRAPLSF